MRSGTDRPRGAVLLALVLSGGCGTWSNDDVAFSEALPTAQALRATLPASADNAAALGTASAALSSSTGGTSAEATCPAPGASDVWGWAKPTGDAFNGAIDFVLGLVDLVRTVTPATRSLDARSWGPFPDAKHPGIETRIEMVRTRDAAGVPTYAYTFGSRQGGQGAYQPVLEGSFQGESARGGKGELTLHFSTLRALGMSDHPETDPEGDVTVGYDRTGDPRTTALHLPTAWGGSLLAEFAYGYASWQSGHGRFSYVFVSPQGLRYEVTAWFNGRGEGLADVAVALDATRRYAFQECWDASGCVTDVKDFLNLSQLCPNGACPSGPCPELPPGAR